MIEDLFCYIILPATHDTQEDVTSDIYFVNVDRLIAGPLQVTKVERCFRFIDDYLVFVDCEQLECESEFTPALCNSKDCSAHLKLAHELTVDNFIKCLNLGLYLSTAGMYVETLSP